MVRVVKQRMNMTEIADEALLDAMTIAMAQGWNVEQRATLLRHIAYRCYKAANELDPRKPKPKRKPKPRPDAES